MKITGDTELKAVLEIDEERMLKTLAWLAPELERLQSPHPLRSVLEGLTVEQIARIGHIPLSEALYVLNLAAGEKVEALADDLA